MPEAAVSAVMQVVAAYAAVTVVLVALDLLWLGVVAKAMAHKRSKRVVTLRRRKIGRGLAAYGLFAMGLLVMALDLPARDEDDAVSSGTQRSPIPSPASAPT